MSRLHLSLTPGIEQRLSAWQHHAERIRRAHEARPTITISREFGCQAYPVAQALEQRLNRADGSWIVMDREVLDYMAQESGLSNSEASKDDAHPIFNSLIYAIVGQHRHEQYEAFPYIKKAIRHFARRGHAILIGRCGVVFTQDLPYCLHLRLTAPLEHRIRRVSERLKISAIEAEKMIVEGQAERDRFIHEISHVDLANPYLYHLVINDSRSTPDDIAVAVVAFLAAMQAQFDHQSGNPAA